MSSVWMALAFRLRKVQVESKSPSHVHEKEMAALLIKSGTYLSVTSPSHPLAFGYHPSVFRLPVEERVW